MSVEPKESGFVTFPIFYGLGEDVIQEIMLTGKRITFEPDTPIIISKDSGNTFFVILEGMGKVSLHRLPENDISLMLLKKGDFFGEMALLDNSFSRTANVVALTELDVLIFEKDGFYAIMRAYPDLALNLARGLGQRIRQMNERMVALTLSPYKKIARTLMLVAGKPPLDFPDPIVLPKLSFEEWLQFCYSNEKELLPCITEMQAAGALTWENETFTLLNISTLKEFAVGLLPQ
ncbi:MAG: cyclic nucleotide-binding domain-containing protein [Cyanobacteria bacterium]|nr:cyclic nucleotide-binding domain-containing protein [Cyanobacteriota bacterium]